MAAEPNASRGGRDACPACTSTECELLLQLPPVPVHVGLLWPTREAALSCAKGGFALALCRRCGYVWNAEFDPAVLSYEGDYDNALHHSPMFAAWERELAESLVERYDLHDQRLAEIGCGDGRFLALLAMCGGNTGVGFEPGHNPERESELLDGVDVTIHPHFADAASLRDARPAFVVTRHVLEHVPDPIAFLSAIRDGVTEGGNVYVEVPNFSWTLERGAFEDLMYEHCGYYTPDTLAHQLASVGFADFEASSTFEGLFASCVAGTAGRPPPPDPVDPKIVDTIRSGSVDFRKRIDTVADELSARGAEGQRLAAWGGGARAVGLLNLVASSDAISTVVDVNPRKQGTYVAGTGHPIVAPEALVEAPPDAVVVVNPVYRDEIGGMLDDLGITTELISI